MSLDDVLKYKIYSEDDFPSHLPKLNELYDDLFQGGKGFRAQLVSMVSDDIGIDLKAQHLLGQTIEFIHNSSLLHDDLVDQSVLRRGKTAAWKKYSPGYAVLAGDYLLARVMLNLSRYGSLQLIEQTSLCISDLLEGEWLQDSVVGDINVEFDFLTKIHELKTSSLFAWCLSAPLIVGHIEGTYAKRLRDVGSKIGILFQRSDDLLDFNIRNYENKSVFSDLQSNYVNSFCCYAFQEKTEQQKRELFGSDSLVDFINHFGQENFNSCVLEFDKVNEVIVQECKDELNQMQDVLSIELIKNLCVLVEKVYWRR